MERLGRQLAERIAAGGYPAALARPAGRRRARWYRDYADALTADRHLLGQLLETFVFQELRRQASWHEAPLRLFHFCDKDGAEVDIVVERGAAHVAGIEVEAAATVTRSDFRGLRKLASAAGERFVGGVVLYDGETSAGFGDNLYAVPTQRLWENL